MIGRGRSHLPTRVLGTVQVLVLLLLSMLPCGSSFIGRAFSRSFNSKNKLNSVKLSRAIMKHAPQHNSMDSTIFMSAQKLVSPAAERNSGPILEVFRAHILPVLQEERATAEAAKILEIASGSGQHAVNLAGTMQSLVMWQPTDIDESSISSICAWTHESGLQNILDPIQLDVSLEIDEIVASLPEGWNNVDGIVNVNMIHISPWSCCEGLWKTAGSLVKAGGFVYMYGPFCVNGAMVESNENFDASLRARNPEWGIRNLEDVSALAAEEGFVLEHTVEMPANNLSLIFRKQQVV
mmetsp:Transcript_47509/g.78988  ORF Transcript_47509/g.78988 Transcript_47509/m.78988 type:complete len:295 (+) Transcript_47509:68-952(+)